MRKKKREKFIDDGRTVADMNIDGMRGYDHSTQNERENREPLELTREERRAISKGMIAAALLVGGIFFAVFALFILFCTHVWMV